MRLTTGNHKLDCRMEEEVKDVTNQCIGRLLGMAGTYFLDKTDVLQMAMYNIGQALISIEKNNMRDMMTSEICHACREKNGPVDCIDCMMLRYME